MKKKVISILLALVLVICAFPNAAFAYSASQPTTITPWYAVCTGDGVYIRDSASTSGTILGQLSINTTVEVIGTSGYWYLVRYNTSGSTGYMFSQYIMPTYSTYGYTTTTANLKSSASASSTTVYTATSYTYMPYNYGTTVSQTYWLHCVRGTTVGWINTGNNTTFKYA